MMAALQMAATVLVFACLIVVCAIPIRPARYKCKQCDDLYRIGWLLTRHVARTGHCGLRLW